MSFGGYEVVVELSLPVICQNGERGADDVQPKLCAHMHPARCFMICGPTTVVVIVPAKKNPSVCLEEALTSNQISHTPYNLTC